MNSKAPLAARMRPSHIDQVVGQAHVLSPGKPLFEAIVRKRWHSFILWGPPGIGKTTIAKLLSANDQAQFIALSAVMSGVKDIREAIDQARHYSRPTVLFVDEVHRFNKSQQDAFLPAVEEGVITFVGATTENPSFSLNNALLSRVRVYSLIAINNEQITEALANALTDPRGLADQSLTMECSLLALLAQASDGDLRRAYNLLERCSDLAEKVISEDLVKQVLTGERKRFDRQGDIFYDQISALHKSVRGSAPDAALYWFTRMIDGGCDPLYIARRVVRMASEDIGNADPRGLTLALQAWDVQTRLGSPEGELTIAQAILYLACAPKSNAVYSAFKKAKAHVNETGDHDVPNHLRNAPTALMKDMGYGANYRYAHDEPQGYAAGVNYFPDGLVGTQYYEPSDRGLEQKIRDKLSYLRQLDQRKR